jgi:hypothetical protein
MATTLVTEYGEGGYDPTKPDGNVVRSYEIDVPDNPADDARSQLEGMLSQHAELQAQIAADAALWAATSPGEALTQAHIDSVGRMLSGLGLSMQAHIDTVTATGLVPPPA